MNIPAVLVANGAAIVLLVILLASSRKTVHYGTFDNTLFAVMILCTMLQCLTETATFLIDGRAGLNTLSLILNSLLYINNIGFAFLWTVYAEYKLFSNISRIKKRHGLVTIPAVLIWIGSLLNLITPVFFTISADNVYQRTGLFPLPYIVTYLYLAYGVGIIYFYRDKVHRYLFLPAVVFMIPILLGSVLQYFFYGYSLVWLGATIALASLYINVQNEVSCVDALSGLFTRQYLLHYLIQQFKSLSADGKLCGIMLDIDHFKEINDTYGHLIGDEAIRAAGHLLRTSLPPHSISARYAGDEFVIITVPGDMKTATETVSRINKNAERMSVADHGKYTLSFSAGCGEYRHKDTPDSFLKRIDDAMYADKRRKYGERRKSGANVV